MFEYELRAIFHDIIRGKSLVVYNNVNISRKHYTNLSLGQIDSRHDEFLEIAKSKKLPTEEERLDYLKKTNQWGKKEEEQIHNHEMMIRGLENTKQKSYLDAQLEQLNSELVRERAGLISLLSRKSLLIGTTQKTWVTNQLNSLYIFHSFFKDNKPFFTEQEWNSLTSEEFNEIEKIYNKNSDKFNIENIQKLSLISFIQSGWSLANESIFNFYGKPIIDLTIYQQDLIKWTQIFSNILSNNKNIPEKLINEPTKLLDWIVSKRNLEEISEKSKGGTLVGLGKSDMEKIGDIGEKYDFINKMKREGKDSMDIHEALGNK